MISNVDACNTYYTLSGKKRHGLLGITLTNSDTVSEFFWHE